MDNLQFHKVCGRWVRKELTDEHKRMRIDIATWLVIAKKVTTFSSGSSQVMKSSFTTFNQKASGRVCNGIIRHLLLRRNQGAIIDRQVDVDHLMGFSRAYF
jgi:hypothetical protein